MCMRTLICSVAIVLLTQAVEARDRAHLKTKQHEPSEWSIGIPRYVVGGIVGSTLGVALPLTALIIREYGRGSELGWSVLGSGFGHAIQGRWRDGPGWGFTVGGLYTFAALLEAIAEEDKRTFAWTLFIGTKLGELITVWLPPRQSALASQEITTARFIGGGLLGTFVGFGSGHLLQGRGIAAAWPYTLTQVAALTLASVEDKCRRERREAREDTNTRRRQRDEAQKTWKYHCGMTDSQALAGLLLFSISKLMEIISLWLPSAREYKIVSADKLSTPKFAVFPLYHNAQPKLVVQLTTAL